MHLPRRDGVVRSKSRNTLTALCAAVTRMPLAQAWGSRHVSSLLAYKSDPLFLCSGPPSDGVLPSHPHPHLRLQSPSLFFRRYFLRPSFLLPRRFFTMFGLTWKLFALFSLILPTLAATIPVRKEVGELEMRATHSGGRVRFSQSSSAHDAEPLAHREPGTHLASVVVVKQIMRTNWSLLFLSLS